MTNIAPAPALATPLTPATAPNAFPAELRADRETAKWLEAPLVQVTETWSRGTQTQTLDAFASARAVKHAYQFEPETDVNAPVFQLVGSNRAEALRVAHERALTSSDTNDVVQAQAVLQGLSGAYYVTGLARHGGPTNFNIDGSTAPGNDASFKIAFVNPAVQAVVGPNTWVENRNIVPKVS